MERQDIKEEVGREVCILCPFSRNDGSCSENFNYSSCCVCKDVVDNIINILKEKNIIKGEI